jgi:arginine/serine-rich splicing factor 18
LPAWIREGLEKMERDKMKKEEREQLLKQRDELFKQRHSEEQARLLMENPARSKFVSETVDCRLEDPKDTTSSNGGKLALCVREYRC